MKKIFTLLAFALVCFTMSAADFSFDLSSLPYTNYNGTTSYDGATKTITWSASTSGTGSMGYSYAAGSYLDASTYNYLVVVLTPVTTGGADANPATCKITYSDGTTTAQSLAKSASRAVYNIALDATKKSAIKLIEFRLFGSTAPTTVTIESITLSAGQSSGVESTTADALSKKTVYDIYGNKVSKLEPNRLYISGGKKFMIK